MSIDLNQNDVKVTPAIEAKAYPLAYMRLLNVVASSPQQVRLYSEYCPYRRVYENRDFPVFNADGTPVIIEGSQTPVLDDQGQPVLDENGVAVLTAGTQLVETRSVLVNEEFKSPEVQGDIAVIEVPNIIPLTAVDAAQEELLQQTIATYLSQGGNIMTMAFTSILLAVKGYGEATGRFAPAAQ